MRAIAAVSKNGVIGDKGSIPKWNCKEDLQFFKAFTMGKDIVMGRKTYENMPVLKGRRLTVLSSKRIFPNGDWPYRVIYQAIPADIRFDSIVCGGAEIYRLLFPYCEDLHLTIIEKIVSGDTRMPEYNSYFPKREKIQEGSGYTIYRYYK